MMCKRGLPIWALAVGCVGLLTVCLATANAEVRPADLARPTDAAGLGPGYGKRVLQFHFDLRAFGGGGFEGEGADGGDRLAFAPRLTVVQPVGFDEAEFSWGIVHLGHTDAKGDVSTLRLGNPFGAYYWSWRTLSRQIRAGLGFTAPVAMTRAKPKFDGEVDHWAYAAASGMRGGTAPWLWASSTMSGLAHFDAYSRSASGFIWGAQVRVASMYGFKDGEDGEEAASAAKLRQGFHLVAQADLDLALDTTNVRAQVRTSYVITPTMVPESGQSEQKDNLVTDAEFRIRLGDADLILGFTVPLDEPAGRAFSPGRFWSARVGVSTGTELRLPEE